MGALQTLNTFFQNGRMELIGYIAMLTFSSLAKVLGGNFKHAMGFKNRNNNHRNVIRKFNFDSSPNEKYISVYKRTIKEQTGIVSLQNVISTFRGRFRIHSRDFQHPTFKAHYSGLLCNILCVTLELNLIFKFNIQHTKVLQCHRYFLGRIHGYGFMVLFLFLIMMMNWYDFQLL